MGRALLCTFTNKGIYCPQGNFYIDPWKPVPRAVITHAHSDHARWGHDVYLAAQGNQQILRHRLGSDIRLSSLAYQESTTVNGVKISFHPAGHVWGSAQIRLEYKGEVWVISGDYKIEPDGFSTPFEPVKCHTFITECTFGLPVFQWEPQPVVMEQIHQWWRQNAAEGKTSILLAYALGKAQRLIRNLDPSIGKVYVHGAIHQVNEALEKSGARLPKTQYASPELNKSNFPGSLIIAPGSAAGTPWMRRFQPYEVAHVSGWMQIRGIRRRRSDGSGFVLSDHADWTGLNTAVEATGAQRVFVTHGYVDVFARWLAERGLETGIVKTQFEGEFEEKT